MLVVQGTRDRFGIPPATKLRTVVEVAGDHSLRTDLDAIGEAVRAWLRGQVVSSSTVRSSSTRSTGFER